MGKDFTPKELHRADRIHHLSECRLDLDGIRKDIQDALWKRYPNMAFLFYERLQDIYLRYEEYEQALKILDTIEEDIRLMIANDDIGAYLTCYDDPKDPMHMLYQWYTGKLDPQFYYARQNHQALHDWIVRKIQEETGIYDDFDKYVYEICTYYGVKHIIIHCMAYQVDDNGDGKDCRLIEYSCWTPLEDIMKMQIKDIDAFVAEHNAYISNMTEKEARHAVLGAKKALALSELTEETPDGLYIEK